MTKWTKARAQVAALTRWHGDDPEYAEQIEAARARLKVAGFAEVIHEAVNTWPPIPDETLAELRLLLTPVEGSGG